MHKHPKERTIPPYFQLTYAKEDIAYRTYQLGTDISTWAEESYKETGEQILGVCILRGGVFFFSDLLKQIAYTVEPSYCRCQSYSSEDNTQGDTFNITVKPEGIEGRHVLLVDDICDSGKTLSKMVEYCQENGAKEVRTAVLIHRIHEESVYTPDYTGFRYEGNEWFAGYGMEDKNHRANYPEVYIIKGNSVD
ncbi:MAG: phosphoribosyltransferase [Opitutales bacterium]|nr:phosphoribosyltransferase [Opitutales bacterium]NRA28394.1 phosphoribosyltransferase [Opitutales bacterium]